MKKAILEKAKKTAKDPVFQKPISEINKDYSKKGTITLVTIIKPQFTWN